VILAQFDAAAPIIRVYLHRKPHDFDAFYLSGVVERGLGNLNEAERDLQQAVALKPDDFEVLTTSVMS
jgi:Flp pilus assembly protein TadD